jgi:hypothetical protein
MLEVRKMWMIHMLAAAFFAAYIEMHRDEATPQTVLMAFLIVANIVYAVRGA